MKDHGPSADRPAPTPEDFGFGQLFWSIRDAVVVGDVETGRIVLWNPAAEILFGLPMDEAVGRSIETLVPDDLRAQHRAGLLHYRHTGRGAVIDGGRPIEVPALRGTGEPIVIELQLTPVVARRMPGRFVVATIRDVTARKQGELDRLHLAQEQAARRAAEQAAEALQQREEQFRTAFDAAAIGMSLIALDGRYLRVNAALCQLTGYSEQELLATTFHAITHPEDQAQDRVELDRLLTGLIPSFQREKRYLRQDGMVVWVRVNSALVHGERGEPRHLISQVEDITERKRSQAALAQRTEELQASEARYRSLVEQLPGAVYLLANDEQQTPLYFSPAIERITGETPEEAMAFRDLWSALVHPEDRDRVVAADEQHGEVTSHFQEEYRLRRKDGSYVWVRDECEPVYNAAGQVVAWQGVMLDITDRLEATQVQAQLAALVESAEDAIVSGTVEGTITSWNPGAERLYGYRPEEIIGQSFRQLLPEDLVDPTYEHLLVAVRSGGVTAPIETTRRRKDGTTFAASVSLSPLRDQTGVITGISSITRDITTQKQTEGALQQALSEAEAANRAKSQFLSMMSHELRTPLQAVLGYAELLLADPRSVLTAEQREDLGYIQQGGWRMLTLITQLLDLSRIEAGRLTLRTRPVDLALILEQVRQDVAPLALQKGLDLRIDLPASLPLSTGDPERLRQILLNLVSNAVKFTEDGSVQVTAWETTEGMVIRVRDTGIGIAPEELPHIFEAFRQVDSGRARRHDGAGLGLAIARKLAELMGGVITVESALGVGSTFTLAVPTAPVIPEAAVPDDAAYP